uniref:Uncharacterized protein n=1 Tax=Romanomermis culicivorax TaxID=13658 RepID=A0A915IRS5_ROMCU
MSKLPLFVVLLAITNFDVGITAEVWPNEIRVGAIFSMTTDKLYLVALRKAVEDLKDALIVPMHVKFK